MLPPTCSKVNIFGKHNNMEETKIDKLRNELIRLRKEREEVIFEKGLAAEENKDLRENFAYDYWFEKECQMNARIMQVVNIIEETSNKSKPKKIIKQRKLVKIKGTYEPHKWL
jgi:transcription elongation GreA/GreB family factor